MSRSAEGFGPRADVRKEMEKPGLRLALYNTRLSDRLATAVSPEKCSARQGRPVPADEGDTDAGNVI